MSNPVPLLAAVALGSNLGDRAANIAAAFAALKRLSRTRLLRTSNVIETEPVGDVSQGPYLNAAAILETGLGPRELLTSLQEIECSRGRDRAHEQRWGARTLDLDLLLFGDRIVEEPGLTIPHPRLHQRAFVLVPLSEVAPEMLVPGIGATVRELAARLRIQQ